VLVLSRKLGEKIHIGNDITITIVDLDRGKVRVGVEAPREVGVWRKEIAPKRTTEAAQGTLATGREATQG
jgi:carbon storage regulator